MKGMPAPDMGTETAPSATDMLQQALSCHRSGDLAQAKDLYQRFLEREPDNADARRLYGRLLLSCGAPDHALQELNRAVDLCPTITDFRSDRADVLLSLGQFSAAQQDWEIVVSTAPDSARGFIGLGIAYLKQGEPEKAVAPLQYASRLAPRDSRPHDRLGVALARTGAIKEAEAAFLTAKKLAPKDAAILNRWGRALYRAGLPEEATKRFSDALILDPNSLEALTGLGAALVETGRPDLALPHLEKARSRAPTNLSTLNNLGLALTKLGRLSDAETTLAQARNIAPDSVNVLNNLGNVKSEQGHIAEALNDYRQALEAQPSDDQAFVNILAQAGRIYDWDTQDTLIGDLPIRLDRAQNDSNRSRSFMPLSFTLPYFCDDNELIGRTLRTVGHGFPAKDWSRDDRKMEPDRCLRVGYLSPDFGDHPISHVTLPIYSNHDRKQVSVFCYATLDRSDAAGPYLAQIKKDCDHFIDVSHLSFSDTADKIRSDKIDILIDMTGYMRHARPQVLSLRPAPIQVYWQGHTGTLGGTSIDYVIGDPTVMPELGDGWFNEAVARLPHCFSSADRHPISDAALTREEFGLSDRAIIFCAFNNPLKIDRETFGSWMRIMAAVPDSQLWLTAPSAEHSQAVLQKRAAISGVSSERLIFASRVPDKSVHLARHKLADLFLDTFHFNASTTALDSLWAGLPVICRRGNNPYSRLTSSYLTALGLSDVICEDSKSYEESAITLAKNSAARQELHRRLAAARLSSPLFDPSLFVRHLETAYRTMWRRCCTGEPPVSFSVPAQGNCAR